MSESAVEIRSLAALRHEEASCRRCPLYKDATQVVPGEDKRREYDRFVANLRKARQMLQKRP